MPPTPAESSPSSAAAKPGHTESIKETLISIVIAFALAFVFRGFVVEAFVIPTGSMAPTLMGAHMRFTSPSTGYSWPVGPWEQIGENEYAPIQGGGRPGGSGGPDSITVHDPMSGDLIDKRGVPLRSGDRILVLKYLYSIFNPQRFDVIVFKNPTNPSINYIKRLIGLPGEEVALIDGDVFTRNLAGGAAAATTNSNSWLEPGWTIARKTSLQQEVAWMPIFDSAYTPLESTTFNRPWNTADTAAWRFDGRVYAFDAAAVKNPGGRSELFFDQTRQRFKPMNYFGVERGEKWTIDDRYPYDETPFGDRGRWAPETFQHEPRYPVSDVRMRAGIEPTADGLTIEATLRARGHEFQAVIEGTTARLRMRTMTGEMGIFGPWKDVSTNAIAPLRPGHVANVEFWHADQSLQLWIDGAVVARHDYDWSPAERVLNSTGKTLEDVLANPQGDRVSALSPPALYRDRRPDVRWAFGGSGGKGGARLYRVGLDRDLYYQPAIKRRNMSALGPGLGTSPNAALKLNADQFFACGDNSPQSLDGRLWDSIDPWVAHEFDDTIGVVPRELLLGRAFFVYWPSLIKGGKGIPVPDFGRMRFIW